MIVIGRASEREVTDVMVVDSDSKKWILCDNDSESD
jgi:hypothetical protein